jgi:hypothetical protein
LKISSTFCHLPAAIGYFHRDPRVHGLGARGTCREGSGAANKKALLEASSALQKTIGSQF